ncbi:MAG: hypothetical protein KC877_05210, partial [Candidatus Kaiserbacteria bacterium]|nr:hypothetical protein [Candidatus Kaiserbacteria bacterium]
ANTVRGLEVQAHRGINTYGENTALSGFARTFGVRGVTTGDAGATYEPAGGYFETEGTTQGNAIRGYSDTITTATLLSLFQSSSDFEGTGLEMNFGNGTGGSFSSSTSKYLDFRNANNPVFTVSAFGTTTIGRNDGSTANLAGLQIPFGGICVDYDGECTASTSGKISARDYDTGNSDLAETYFSSAALETGEVVTLAGELSIERANRDSVLPILGVVSTKPGITLGADDVSLTEGETRYPVALTGRVPVKLSTENGPIKKGDQLMLSSLPGIAMKATGTGATIGIALEDFDDERMYSETYINQFGDDMIDPVFEPIFTEYDPRIDDGCYFGGGSALGEDPCVPLNATTTEGRIEEANDIIERESVAEALQALRETESETIDLDRNTEVKVGQIVMFVDRGFRWVDDAQLAGIQALMGTSSIEVVGDNEDETIFDRLVALANRFVDGVLSVFTLKADRVEIANELCVDGVCVTADDLRLLLDVQAATTDTSSTNNTGSAGGSTNTDSNTSGGQTQGGNAGTEPDDTASSTDQTASSTNETVPDTTEEQDAATSSPETVEEPTTEPTIEEMPEEPPVEPIVEEESEESELPAEDPEPTPEPPAEEPASPVDSAPEPTT